MATANILSIKNQGMVAYDGSATFNGRTISATSSKISISNGNGVSGNPSIDVVEANLTLNNIGGTLGVSKGGTGANTLTQNSLLLGNGTSAVSALGAATNGQIPIGSTGNAPVLGTITAGAGVTITNGAGTIQIDSVGSAANANAVLDESDDFVYRSEDANGANINFGWGVQDTGADAGPAVTTSFAAAGRPGVFALTTGTSSTTGGFLLSRGYGGGSTSSNSLVLGGGIITLQWFVKIATLSSANRYILRLGLMDCNDESTIPANGVWFEYTDNVNSGNWQIKSSASSSVTAANTTTAASTSWVVLKIIINAGATSVAYYINGTQVANSPISTNIPSAPVVPQVQMHSTAGTTNRAIGIDLYTLQQVLTTAR